MDLERAGPYLVNFIWPLLGLVAVAILIVLRGVVVAGKWRRRQFVSRARALDADGHTAQADITSAVRAERATDFWEMLARRLYYGVALTAAIGLLLAQFLPLAARHRLILQWLLMLVTFGSTLIVLWYWQGWDDERERFLRKRLRLAYEREQARRGLAVRDDVTGLYTREFFCEELRRELGRVFRHSRPISCIILDVGGLGSFKLRWGETPTRHTIKRLAQSIEQNVRSYDVVADFGSGRFAIALLKCKPENADTAARRVVGNVTQLVLMDASGQQLSDQLELRWTSCGLPREQRKAEEAIAAAERTLDRASNGLPSHLT
jgi:diguanylate cyclase (GGDEF)-like protein